LHLAREAVRPGRANGIRSAFLLGAERVIAIDTEFVGDFIGTVAIK
jgi:hypothetical protein